jgi:4-alpha-glucanotransferase
MHGLSVFRMPTGNFLVSFLVLKILRSSGILLHPTSLPGRFGIGDLGPQAFGFVDFLQAAGQRIWQVLPLGPTGYGDSPYQCFSAFAGNPLLLSPECLFQEGLLTCEELESYPTLPDNRVDYGLVTRFKLPLLKLAADRFLEVASPAQRDDFEQFCSRHARWLDDYALFMSLKEANEGKPWPSWEPAIARRRPEALQEQRRLLESSIFAHRFYQYQFYRQWSSLRRYASGRGLIFMGDIPIFLAHDSADVWAQPEHFKLNRDGSPKVVAGVPPDYFSPTGQRWGNPIYRWQAMARTGFAWWIERFRSVLELVDIVRLDHFRGFESYWEIPALEETAINGRWVRCPGNRLFAALQRAVGNLPIVAENLGVITPEVEALRKRFGFPGMAVLQFAFGDDNPDSPFLPHNFKRNLVVYVATHDNDTTIGWWNSVAGTDSTRSAADIQRERSFVMRYLNTDGRELNWALIRSALASVADLAIVTSQDLLGVGNEGRMNTPSRASGNWSWRCPPAGLSGDIALRLLDLTRLYSRYHPS